MEQNKMGLPPGSELIYCFRRNNNYAIISRKDSQLLFLVRVLMTYLQEFAKQLDTYVRKVRAEDSYHDISAPDFFEWLVPSYIIILH